MKEANNKKVRQVYEPPRIRIFVMADECVRLLEASTGTFNDMEYGGDLGGGGSSGFEDMEVGGDLGGGGSSGNGSAFGDMLWGGDLGGTVSGSGG